MARHGFQHEKRQRELDKKRKRDAKKLLKDERKNAPALSGPEDPPPDGVLPDDSPADPE